MSSRVVVLGASGFVGRYVAARAEADGFTVVRLSSTDVDLMSPESIPALAAVLADGDTVVHSAAIAPSRNAADVSANLTMTQHLVDAAKGLALAQVVVVSSDAVYGSASGMVTEESTCAPDSLHGVMSLGRELVCGEIATEALTIVRPAPVYGVGDTHNSFGPNRFARQALESRQVTLFGAGGAGRDHVAVTDVAEVIVRSIHSRETGVVNVASGHMRTFAEVAEIVRSAGPDGTTIVSTGSEPTPTYRSFDLSGLVRRFPDLVPITPEAGITAMVREMAVAK